MLRIIYHKLPNFLKPVCYRLYSIYLNFIGFLLERRYLKELKHLLASKDELGNKELVYIIQPTFYDIKGEKYLSGGAERYLNDLSKIIMDMGYAVLIIQMGDKPWYKKHNDIHVVGVPSNCSKIALNKLAHNSIFGEPKLTIYSPFSLAYPNINLNSIGISHGIFWDHPGAASLMSSIKKSFIALNMIVSVDTSTLTWFRGSMPDKVKEKKLKYIPNYVDLRMFYPGPSSNKEKIVILYPRRLYKPRGYFLVSSIIEEILKKYDFVEFHFVGQAEKEAESSIENLIQKFGNRVHFYQEEDKNMHNIYRKADIVLIPTVASEGTSLSCIEAMATGNAIIATNIGGLSDLIIDNFNGLLISPDAAELKSAIEKLIELPELRHSLGQNALNVAKSFDKKRWEEHWSEILTSRLIK